jgi:hypothetical protein
MRMNTTKIDFEALGKRAVVKLLQRKQGGDR